MAAGDQQDNAHLAVGSLWLHTVSVSGRADHGLSHISCMWGADSMFVSVSAVSKRVYICFVKRTTLLTHEREAVQL